MFGQRVFVLLCLGALVVTGVFAYRDLPIEAFPDLTNNQVVVITGSFSFTKTAEQNNAESLLVIRSKDRTKVCIENWESHKEHAGRYGGGRDSPAS